MSCVLFVFFLSLICAHTDAGAKQLASKPITVYCASSATDAIEAIASDFERKHGIRVLVSSAGSQALAQQIANGATPDIFISAHPKWIDFLRTQSLITDDRPVAANQLVLIASRTTEISSLQSLTSDAVSHIAIGDPHAVPAGMYARQALESVNLWSALQSKLAPFANVRQALSFVEHGEAQAGFVYRSDVINRQVHVVLEIGADVVAPSIIAARVTSSQPHAQSAALHDFLQTPEAQRVFSNYGFVTTRKSLLGSSTMPQSKPGWLTEKEWIAAWLSLKVAAVAVMISLPPGIVLGYWLSRRRFRGQWIVESILTLPLVLPPVVSGYALLLLFGRAGPFGSLLYEWFGIQVLFTWKAAALAAAVVSFPLMFRTIRLGFGSNDRRLAWAARSLGASRLRAFLTISLPLAKHSIIAGVSLAFARSLGEFGATIMVASNIEGVTRTIPLAIFQTVESEGVERAWTLVIMAIVIASVALLLGELIQRKATNHGAA